MRLKKSNHFASSDDFQTAREVVLPPEIPERALTESRIFGSRLTSLDLVRRCKHVLEIGVLGGDFSVQLAELPELATLTLLDNYTSDDWPWFQPPRFDSSKHLSFIKNKFKHDPRISVIQGDSSEELRKLPKNSFDFIYIDANHSYEGVKLDCELSIPLLSNGGYLCFNDYIMHDYRTNRDYGIVRVVNELLFYDARFEVAGLALNNHMFSDIYLRFDSSRT